MKTRCIIVSLLLLSGPSGWGQYTDHRDRQLDSLEALVEPWTESRVATASPEQLDLLGDAYHDLMWGYAQINPSRSLHFARKSYALSLKELWLNQAFQAAKMIGQHYWAAEQTDSAKVYFDKALSIADRMALKEPLPGKPDGYKDSTIDDAYSSLYGALGNMYAEMDSLQVAMEYYRKAGEIFERNAWWESCSVLYHNMGETWLDAGKPKEAGACYDKALYFGREAEDSLLIVEAKAGLGALYLEQGKTGKALRLLQEADQYFSANENQEYRSRIYTLDLTGKVLAAQKRQSRALAAGAVLLSLALIALVLVLLRANRLRRQKDAADVVIGEVLAEREGDSPAKPANDDFRAGDDGMVAGDDARHGRPDRPSLTDREKEILPLLAAGLSSKEIADRICLTEQTIKWYRMRLLEKMDAKNTAGMLTRAKELGLL